MIMPELFGKKVDVLIRKMSLEELSGGPLPDSAFNYVHLPEFKHDGFEYRLFFFNKSKDPRSRPYPHIVLQQLPNRVDSGKPLTFTFDANYLKDEVLKKLIPSVSYPLLFRISGGMEPVTDIWRYRKVSEAIQDILGVGYPAKDKNMKFEIHGTFDLRKAAMPSGARLSQRNAAKYISEISNTQIFPEFQEVDAHYMNVRERNFNNMDLRDKSMAFGFS